MVSEQLELNGKSHAHGHVRTATVGLVSEGLSAKSVFVSDEGRT